MRYLRLSPLAVKPTIYLLLYSSGNLGGWLNLGTQNEEY